MSTHTVDTGEVDLDLTLAPFAMLLRDPTLRLSPGRFQRATHTPEGPGVVDVSWQRGRPEARVTTDGPGGAWLAERAPGMLGLRDDPAGFAPAEDPVRDLWRRHRGDRVPATGTLWHDLAWFVLQQRVTRAEAAVQWYRFVRGLGTPAPGADGLMVPPSPTAVARLGYEQLHRFGIERRRAEHLVAGARCVHHWERAGTPLEREATVAALLRVRGVGPWTTACLEAFTWGHADIVITGDAGIPSMVAWLLAGERRADDARMLQLLEPFRPHRYRVVRLVLAAGTRPPRRGPRVPRTGIRGR